MKNNQQWQFLDPVDLSSCQIKIKQNKTKQKREEQETLPELCNWRPIYHNQFYNNYKRKYCFHT